MKHKVRERAIFALLDGTLSEGRRRELEQHLEDCEECRLFYQHVRSTQAFLRRVADEPPPPVNWSQVDAAIEAGIAGQRQRQRSLWSGLSLWGTVAATAAAAVLLFLLIVPQSRSNGDGQMARANGEARSAASDASTPGGDEQDPSVTPFVVFVAGDATLAPPGEDWHPLSLESDLAEGSRIRTADRGRAGFQLSRGQGCQLESDSQVRLSKLQSRSVRLEVERGRVVCRTDEAGPEVVLSVVEMVASASGDAHFALERREPEVVVIDLTEGSLQLSEVDEEVGAPGHLELRRSGGGSFERSRAGDLEPPSLPPVYLLAHRTISSLQIPVAPGVDRVRIDGVDYGPLPLSLRRRPGQVRIELLGGRAEPMTHEVRVGLGPRLVELTPLVPSELRDPTHRPQERQIEPRIGTYTKAQQQRFSALVGGQVQRCYDRVLKRYPNVRGRIAVRVNISISGQAQRVAVRSLSGGHEDVNRCVEQSVRNTRFPPPRGGYVPIEQIAVLAPRH